MPETRPKFQFLLAIGSADSRSARSYPQLFGDHRLTIGRSAISITSFMALFRQYVRSSWLGRVLLIPWRLKNALASSLPPVLRSLAWAFKSREHYNYTYDLQPLNVEYLASFVAVVTGEPFKMALKYIREIEADTEL